MERRTLQKPRRCHRCSSKLRELKKYFFFVGAEIQKRLILCNDSVLSVQDVSKKQNPGFFKKNQEMIRYQESHKMIACICADIDFQKRILEESEVNLKKKDDLKKTLVLFEAFNLFCF